jgi:hypothetical protein
LTRSSNSRHLCLVTGHIHSIIRGVVDLDGGRSLGDAPTMHGLGVRVAKELCGIRYTRVPVDFCCLDRAYTQAHDQKRKGRKRCTIHDTLLVRDLHTDGNPIVRSPTIASGISIILS